MTRHPEMENPTADIDYNSGIATIYTDHLSPRLIFEATRQYTAAWERRQRHRHIILITIVMSAARFIHKRKWRMLCNYFGAKHLPQV